MKLFMCVFFGKREGVAVFGLKDYQQLLIVKRLVRQFALPIEVVGGAIERDEDGLALSSRNAYLSVSDRQRASLLYQCLSSMVKRFRIEQSSGQLDPNSEADQLHFRTYVESLEAEASQALSSAGWLVDYICLRRQDTLQVPGIGDPSIVLGAARLGTTRLIDNLEC